MDTIKRIKALKMPNHNQSFVINTGQILDTKEYLTAFDLKPDKNETNVLTSITNLLREDFKKIISQAEELINEYVNAKANKPDNTVFKDALNSFKKALEPLTKHLNFDTKIIFISDLIVQTCENAFLSSFPMIKGEIIITPENYKAYKESVISLITTEVEQVFPENKDEITYEIEEYLLNRVADYTKEPIYILQEIKESLLLLKNIFKTGIPETNIDIYNQLYILTKKYGGIILCTEIDNFMPKLIKSESDNLTNLKSDVLIQINRFSHFVLLIIYRILKHKVPIKQCPACRNYFIPSRPNKIYCDGTLPNTNTLCKKKGPQILRNQRLSAHEKEYEKAKKRIERYCKRHEISTKEENKRIRLFFRNYEEEKQLFEKNYNMLQSQMLCGKTGYDRDKLLKLTNDFLNKIKTNCKDYLDTVDPRDKWV